MYHKQKNKQSNNFGTPCETPPNNFEISQKTFVVTPISKDYKTKKGEADSKRNYEEQIKLAENGNTWMWDDAKSK